MVRSVSLNQSLKGKGHRAKSCPKRQSPPQTPINTTVFQRTCNISQLPQPYSANKINRIFHRAQQVARLSQGINNSKSHSKANYSNLHPNQFLSQQLPPIQNVMYLSNQKWSFDQQMIQSLTRKNVQLAVMCRQMHSFMTSAKEMKWMLKQVCDLSQRFITQAKTGAKASKGVLYHLQNIRKQLDALYLRFTGLQRRDWNEVSNLTREEHQCSIGPYVNQNSAGGVFQPMVVASPANKKLLAQLASPHPTLDKENQPARMNSIAQFQKLSLPKADGVRVAQMESLLTAKQAQLTNQTEAYIKKQAQLQQKLACMSKENIALREQIQALEGRSLLQETVIRKQKEYLQGWLREVGQIANSDVVWKQIKIMQKQLQISELQRKDQEQREESNKMRNGKRYKGEKHKKMQEIISLQYDIKALLLKKESLQSSDPQETARMMVIQALTLEEILLN